MPHSWSFSFIRSDKRTRTVILTNDSGNFDALNPVYQHLWTLLALDQPLPHNCINFCLPFHCFLHSALPWGGVPYFSHLPPWNIQCKCPSWLHWTIVFQRTSINVEYIIALLKQCWSYFVQTLFAVGNYHWIHLICSRNYFQCILEYIYL